MSVRGRADAVFAAVCTLAFLPGRATEEVIHALVARPFADAVDVDVLGGTTRVKFREGTPRWARAAAHLAPEALAAVAGVAVIAWWVLGDGAWWPASMLDWVLLWWLGVQYVAIATPSAADADWRGDG